MKKPAGHAIRVIAAAFVLGLLVAGLTACSATETSQTQSLPTLVPPPTSTPQAYSVAMTQTSTPVSTAAAVSVSSEQTSTEASRPRQMPPATSPPGLGGGSVPPGPAAGTPSQDSAIAQQMVAAFENVLYGIYEKALPSVVYIRVPNPDAARFRDIPGVPDDLLWSAGSGFVWDDAGHVITNHHVVQDVVGTDEEVTVIFPDSTQVSAKVIGSDSHSDLAVLKLEHDGLALRPATLGDSGEVRVGQLTVAIGAPFGQEFTMTSGIVSAVGRNIRGEGQFTIPEVIQTDSAINPGNSGGPLLDSQGRVIGINTQIISRTGNFSGVGMAVPVNIAKRVVPPLIEDGEFDYPWLGVNIIALNPAHATELALPESTRGALIIAVVIDSPAHRAGLRGSEDSVEVNGVDYPAGGDIIVAIGSQEILGSSELIAHLTYNHRPGDTATFTILRDGELEEVEVTLGNRPALR